MTESAIRLDNLVKTFDIGFLGSVPLLGRISPKIQIKGIAKRVEAVRGMSLTVEPGELFGFLGPNGAGKTTTIKMMMGLVRPTSGTGYLLGAPLGDRKTRGRLGFLPEHPYFYEYLKPLEFLDFYARLFSMTARTRKKRAEALIDRVGLRHAINRPLRKFSKGMVQRIGIAQALINNPDLVVLDEPMSGLDPMGRKDVRDLIFELKEQGKTVFFSSHIMHDVEEICDRVAIVVRGRVRSAGLLSELLDTPSKMNEVTVTGIAPEAIDTLKADAENMRHVAGNWIFTVKSESQAERALIQHVYASNARLISVVPVRRSLEEVFVQTAEANA